MERERWEHLLPLVREFHPAVIALCMDEGGIPTTVEGRLAVAGRLVDGLTEAGVAPGDIYLDPLLLPVATDTAAGAVFLTAVGRLRERYPEVHLICGLSNVSFGLPLRLQINQVFLVLALARGMDAFILDPLDRRLMANLITATLLLDRDEFCQNYIRAVRSGRLDFLKPAAGRRRTDEA
jgi:5-methyltetrahydrofolate--homocysteine methyltransferase